MINILNVYDIYKWEYFVIVQYLEYLEKKTSINIWKAWLVSNGKYKLFICLQFVDQLFEKSVYTVATGLHNLQMFGFYWITLYYVNYLIYTGTWCNKWRDKHYDEFTNNSMNYVNGSVDLNIRYDNLKCFMYIRKGWIKSKFTNLKRQHEN